MSISKERSLIINLIYSWVQDHTMDWILTSASQSDESIDTSSSNFTHVIRSAGVDLDLLTLVDRLELLLRNRLVNAKGDGCFCTKCNNFYPMAQPNQSDGTLICYSCRNP